VIVAGLLDNGTWSACFGLSYRDTCQTGILAGEIRHVAGSGQVAAGRNHIVRRFLDTGGEWLWFCDVDMGFEPDAVAQLWKSADPEERPIVGGLCFGLKRVSPGVSHSDNAAMFPALFTRPDEYTPMWNYPRDQMVQVAATGAAFLLIHRSVLEQLSDWFTPILRGDGIGEDLSFCERAIDAGFPIHVNTAVKTVHHKGFLYLSAGLYDLMRRSDGAG
jgi:GT2 family glycosyltransferase